MEGPHATLQEEAPGGVGPEVLLAPKVILAMQGVAGNRAVSRLLAHRSTAPMLIHRMTDAAASEYAVKAGVAKAEADEKTSTGKRYDPKAKTWVTPSSEAIYDAYILAYDKAPDKSKFALTYVTYEEKRGTKASSAKDKTKPINVENDSELKALWGSSATFDKWERARAIAKMFTDAGYKVGAIEESSESSSATPPVLFDVIGHPMIAKFEIHPGGGIHKAPYIRISSNKGMIKVRNDSIQPAYDKLTEAAVKYVNVAIAGAVEKPKDVVVV